jgi:hypothetical protein
MVYVACCFSDYPVLHSRDQGANGLRTCGRDWNAGSGLIQTRVFRQDTK